MNKFKILVLTKNMSAYRAAYYQQDFLLELSNQAECYHYGPGFPGYVAGQSISQVLKQSNFEPDFVFTAHSFLEDNPKKPLESMPGMALKTSPIPIFGLLNKEYSRLSEKIDFFSDKSTRALFTHHHNLEQFTGKTGIPHFFLPFGVDPARFSFSTKVRKYDVGFTGLLKNPTFGRTQADTRIELLREIYFSVFDVPFWAKPEYSHLKIIWKSWTGMRLGDLLGTLIGHGKLSEDDYVRALKSAKTWINAPSPLGIISTRYFECMASGSVVLTQDSPALANLFPRHLMATFKDVSDFPFVLERTLANPAKLRAMTCEARDFVVKNHTWKIRIDNMLKTIAESLRC